MLRAVGGCLLVAMLACAEQHSEAASGELELRAGDSLFEHLEAARVVGQPTSVLPASAIAQLHNLLSEELATNARERVYEFSGAAWNTFDGEGIDAQRAAFGTAAKGAKGWSLRTDIGLDVPLGRVWLEHEGRRLRPFRRDKLSGRRRWGDNAAPAMFSWDAERGEVIALSAQQPGALRVGFDRAPETDLLVWEARSEAEQTSNSARALLRRVTVQRQHRPALAVMAPTQLEWHVDRLIADSLQLQVAAPMLGLQTTAGQLRNAAQLSDGVQLGVELVLDSAPRETVQLWSATLQPEDAWLNAQVDLSGYREQAFTLRLTSSGGAQGDTTCDYVLWSELRFNGGKQRAPSRPHVILIDLDTLRADRLGLYGSENNTSPLIDAWAEREGIVFENARATSDWTLPTTASMLTGLSVPQHGVTRIGHSLQAAHGSLALRLAAEGYETWALTDGGVVVPENGFADGFDNFNFNTETDQLDANLEQLTTKLRARRSERPLFLFVQSYAAHTPYLQDRRFVKPGDVPQGALAQEPITDLFIANLLKQRGGPLSTPEVAYVSALYDAGVARIDASIGPFLEALDEALDGERYLLVLTSDHGEELLERGQLGHGNSLHSELLNVPLVLRLPDGPRGIRATEAVSALDLVPTILAQLGMPVPASLTGRNLMSKKRNPAPNVAQHRVSGWSIEWNQHKLISGAIGREPTRGKAAGAAGDPLRDDFPQTVALYNLNSDPSETNNLAEQSPELAQRLAERLDAWLDKHQPVLSNSGSAPPLSAAQIEQLSQLGYVEDG